MLYGLAVVELGDVDPLAEQLPKRFTSWDAKITAIPFQAIFCGWSKRYRRLVGYLVEHATKMEPKLLLSGHHLSPQCDDRFPGYDAADDLSDRAERGERVEEFHAVVGRHIKAVADGGGYADRGHVGGWLQYGTITSNGTVIRDLCDLDIGDLDALAAA